MAAPVLALLAALSFGFADFMGCSASTVNNHVSKGLAALRALLAAPTAATPGRTA